MSNIDWTSAENARRSMWVQIGAAVGHMLAPIPLLQDLRGKAQMAAMWHFDRHTHHYGSSRLAVLDRLSLFARHILGR